jgi:hypoxanthine phosphoribosyltransferase
MDIAFTKFPIFYYSYDEIETFCLSKREQLAQENFGLVLGVLRGGGIPAVMLSQMLSVPVDFIYYERRTARAEIKNPEAMDQINLCVKQEKKILLVEDMAGVGYTLANSYKYLHSLVRIESLIKVLVLVSHEGSRVKPDYSKDCTGIRPILPWERYVTGNLFLNDFVAAGEALLADQPYKKILAINDHVTPFIPKPEWKVDYHLQYEGDIVSTFDAIATMGPEEIYCNNESLISLILKKFSFVIVYKVIQQERFRIIFLD